MVGVLIRGALEVPAGWLVSAQAMRVDGLDTVRAFAALSVMLAHILGPGMPDLLGMVRVVPGELVDLSKYAFTGYPAVVAFFVVSGFCIHYPYINRPLPISAFWAARWVRILIPALVAMALARVLSIIGFNFWDGYILWSLICELFYYSLYPVFILLSGRIGWSMQLFIAVGVSYSVPVILGSDEYGNAHVYGPFLNWLVALPSWLAGCVLAERVVRGRYPGEGHNVSTFRLCVALTASGLYWLTMNSSVGYYLTMNAFAILVVYWLGAEISSARNRGASGLLEGIGKFSFSIYLFHIIAFALVSRILHPDWTGLQRLVAIPFILAFSYLAYRLFEKPSHAYARRLFARLRERQMVFTH